MDAYARPYYDQTYFVSNYQTGPTISVTNYTVTGLVTHPELSPDSKPAA